MSKPTVSQSPAARSNSLVLTRLQRVHTADPETNLLEALPEDYTSRLMGRKKPNGSRRNTEERTPKSPAEEKSVDSNKIEDPYHLSTDSATVVFPLSTTASSLLELFTFESTGLAPGLFLSNAIARVIRAGEVLWPPPERLGMVRKVKKCSGGDLVLKIDEDNGVRTEHATLQYLEKHKSDLPAPKAHGLVLVGRWRFCFMSFVPGVALKSVWPAMSDTEKWAVSNHLNAIFMNLRKIEFAAGSALGSVYEGVCTDARRHIRSTTGPMNTIDEFDEFGFSNPAFGSEIYIEFLKRISRNHQPIGVAFTHGDVKTENIIVQRFHDESCTVSGVIDWEMSGFYPEDFECTKVTNTLSPNEDDDWFLFLPECIAHDRFAARLLLDRMWTKYVQ